MFVFIFSDEGFPSRLLLLDGFLLLPLHFCANSVLFSTSVGLELRLCCQLAPEDSVGQILTGAKVCRSYRQKDFERRCLC